MAGKETELNTVEDIIIILKEHSSPESLTSMLKFGINAESALGVKIPILRQLSRQIGKNHNFAQELWKTEIHECRILASMIDEAGKVNSKQMDEWTAAFNSWDLCDQCCYNLFRYTSISFDKAMEWSFRPEEFVKRAGFALMAGLAIGDKTTSDDKFEQFFPAIKRESVDERNFVKKSVNWALRQIGKRSPELNQKAIELSMAIAQIDSKSARWIAKDALKELNSLAVQERLNKA